MCYIWFDSCCCDMQDVSVDVSLDREQLFFKIMTEMIWAHIYVNPNNYIIVLACVHILGESLFIQVLKGLKRNLLRASEANLLCSHIVSSLSTQIFVFLSITSEWKD